MLLRTVLRRNKESPGAALDGVRNDERSNVGAAKTARAAMAGSPSMFKKQLNACCVSPYRVVVNYFHNISHMQRLGAFCLT